MNASHLSSLSCVKDEFKFKGTCENKILVNFGKLHEI